MDLEFGPKAEHKLQFALDNVVVKNSEVADGEEGNYEGEDGHTYTGPFKNGVPHGEGNERIEKVLPRTLQRYQHLNDLLRAYIDKNDIEHLDVSSLNCEIDYPDGIHYSNEGHEKIGKMLFEKIISTL